MFTKIGHCSESEKCRENPLFFKLIIKHHSLQSSAKIVSPRQEAAIILITVLFVVPAFFGLSQRRQGKKRYIVTDWIGLVLVRTLSEVHFAQYSPHCRLTLTITITITVRVSHAYKFLQYSYFMIYIAPRPGGTGFTFSDVVFTYLFPSHSWKLILPWLVSAEKLGNISPRFTILEEIYLKFEALLIWPGSRPRECRVRVCRAQGAVRRAGPASFMRQAHTVLCTCTCTCTGTCTGTCTCT